MSQIKENKMGVMPVNKLLITMSLPMMASMLVQALYNIVDSMFVAQINEEALTALSLAFPVQNLMIGVATGTGVGMNALLSKSLGEKNRDRADKAAANGVLSVLVASVLFILFGLFGSRLFFSLQTDDNLIIEYGVQYLAIVCAGSPFLYMSIISERLMQATGKTMLSMYTQGIGAVTNIILDPIFIFVFGWDVVGAATATVVGQICSAFVGLFFNQRFNPEAKLDLKKLRFHGKTVRRIYSVGFPSIIMVAIGSVMNFALNKMLITFYTTTAAAVLGAYYKIQSFAFMPIFGMNNGVVPIIAYNYGAGKRSRIEKCIKLSVIYATGIMLVAIAVFQIFPDALLRMFNASEDMLNIGVPAFRIISVHYLIAGFCIAIGSIFQAFGKGVLSMVVSICRQLLVLVPSAYLLAMFFPDNINMFWLCFIIAEVVSGIVSLICYGRINRTIIKRIPDNF
ncbi:MAG: MATE family efflux transporter [Acutalibacteraceae bacterium]|nr:MATE family efflux transporter [Acutalibacteraceae bacterium]